jgi:hypothetical protein
MASLENYTFLTSGVGAELPNVYAGLAASDLTGISNAHRNTFLRSGFFRNQSRQSVKQRPNCFGSGSLPSLADILLC